MQLIKKYKKDEKITSFTIISGSDEPFRQTKDQRARIVRVALYIPNKLIKKSNSGKHEYL
jgi:hypothetical protein